MERFTQEAFDEHFRQNPLLVLDDVPARACAPESLADSFSLRILLDGYVDAAVRHLVLQSGHELVRSFYTIFLLDETKE
ncbi:hypothetical protein MY11210_003005 [Beauveria gryllotalpidicola]